MKSLIVMVLKSYHLPFINSLLIPQLTFYLSINVLVYSLPQEDSDYERELTPPTPPPRKYSRRGASFKLACIGKQDSDENPLMRRVAAPLKFAQAQVG